MLHMFIWRLLFLSPSGDPILWDCKDHQELSSKSSVLTQCPGGDGGDGGHVTPSTAHGYYQFCVQESLLAVLKESCDARDQDGVSHMQSSALGLTPSSIFSTKSTLASFQVTLAFFFRWGVNAGFMSYWAVCAQALLLALCSAQGINSM